MCELCGEREGQELHHCIFHASKRKGKRVEEFDHEINLMLVCSKCHHEKGHGREEREKFIENQIRRYGIGEVINWYLSIPRGLYNKEIELMIALHSPSRQIASFGDEAVRKFSEGLSRE
jgi:hypothetical protein